MGLNPVTILDKRYARAEYDTRIKARLLLYFSIALIVFLPGLLASNLLSGYSISQKPLLIIPAETFAMACGIILLYRGHYALTAGFFVTVMTCGLLVFIILDTFSGLAPAYHINTLYYVFAILLFSALFGSWRWLIILPAVFLAFGIVYFISLHVYMNMPLRIVRGVLIDFSFSLIMVSALSLLIKKIDRSIITKLEEYNARLKKEFDTRIDLERQILSMEETIRRRIGQDLHDDMGQHLIAVKMRCEMLERTKGAKGAGRSADRDRLLQLINEAIEKIRRTARGLGSVRLNAENFISSLKHLAADSREMYGISCRLKYTRPPALHDDLTAINLYRIAQESITNAVKHGKARQVTMELTTRGDELTMEIANDGIVYRGDREGADGLGIKLMKYRSDLIGGDFSIRAGDKSGTVVRCSLRNPAGRG
ncbi:MAG: sensor histidine kinase [Spirochaetes bacterium]|nr:sensor histidine kinase [Spirochaetota bacterium]